MKETIQLSLIVPVYNVALFLSKCLQSLVNQDLRGIEIILVDDGSTDECPTILEQFRQRYPEAIQIVRQENGGLSAARNTGLEAAKGCFVAFVDSDDWINPDYYRQLMQLAVENKLDMAHGNAWFHYEGRQQDRLIYTDEFPREVMTGAEVLCRRLSEQSFLHMVWMHLYRREFIESRGLRFIQGLIHEDVLWTTRAFLEADRVAYDPNPGYFYRIRLRRDTPPELDKRLERVIESSIINAAGLAEMAASITDAKLHKLIRWQLVDGGLSVFHKLKKIHSQEVRDRIIRKIREKDFYRLLWKNSTLPAQRRRIARNWMLGLLKR